MSNISCVLDACTVINLIHIDQDDFLLKKMGKLDIHVNDFVFTEIQKNVFIKLEDNRCTKYSNKSAIAENRKAIEQKLAFFRGKKNDNKELLDDLGKDYFERFQALLNYGKKANGELYSTAYALYLSRFNSKRIFFYTDDYPAKEYFSLFYTYQQIGQVNDTVDLLILLYWLDDGFTQVQLDNTLSDLHSQYAMEVTLLKSYLQSYYIDKMNGAFLKANSEITKNLQTLILKLNKFEFNGIGTLRDFFLNKKAKCREINIFIAQFPMVFELEHSDKSENLLQKIKKTRDNIKANKIHKWEDLYVL